MMPATDDDARIIATLTPGTRVHHWRFGLGTVADQPAEYGQIPVMFDNSEIVAFCYPTYLRHDHPVVEVDAVPADDNPDEEVVVCTTCWQEAYFDGESWVHLHMTDA